jgi:predicted dehydrogenase/nucleoside-diphosphate-sugar epimerase
MNDITIGILGCGLIADTHVEAILDSVPNARIIACDPLPGKAALLQKKYCLHGSCQSLQQLLQTPGLFSVHILTPPQLHFQNTRECLEAGMHVLAEKPLVLSVAEARHLFGLAQSRGLRLTVDHSVVFQPCVAKALEAHRASGSACVHINSVFGIDDSNAFRKLANSHWKRSLVGGTVVDTIIHPISLAAALTGPVHDVSVHKCYDQGMLTDLRITWSGEKCSASVLASTRGRPFRRTTEIISQSATYFIDHSTETLAVVDDGFGPRSLRKLHRNFELGRQIIGGTLKTVWSVARKHLKQNPGARNLIAAFYRSLESGGVNPTPEPDVLAATDVLERALSQLSETHVLSARKENVPSPIPQADRRPILVTGASGLLGRDICQALSASGFPVHAQVRRSHGSDQIGGPGIERIFCDLQDDFSKLKDLVTGVQDVVHCIHAAGKKDWPSIHRINVELPVALYQEARGAGCRSFIFISSVAVYGVHQRKRITVSEQTPMCFGRSHWDFYIRSKSMAEQRLQEEAAHGGPTLIILRPGPLFSRDGVGLVRRSVPLRKKRLLITFGNGANHTPFTRTDVLAATIVRILSREHVPTGVFNVTGQPSTSTREFLAQYLATKGEQGQLLALPGWPFRLLGTTLELVSRAAGAECPPRITRYMIDSNTRNIFYDCSRAAAALEWDQQQACKFQ